MTEEIEQFYKGASYIQDVLESPNYRSSIRFKDSSIIEMIGNLQHSYRMLANPVYRQRYKNNPFSPSTINSHVVSLLRITAYLESRVQELERKLEDIKSN